MDTDSECEAAAQGPTTHTRAQHLPPRGRGRPIRVWVLPLLAFVGITTALFGAIHLQLLCVALLDVRFEGWQGFAVSFWISGLLAAALWLLLFRKHVSVGAGRVVMALAALTGMATLTAVSAESLASHFTHAGILWSLEGAWIVGWGLWLALLALIFRPVVPEGPEMTVVGRRLQVRCVACGYSMAGLHEARCPECGRRYTLDELVAGQGRIPEDAAEGPAS